MLEVIIACEGQTEREFCRSVLKPYLASKGINLSGKLVGKPGNRRSGIRPWNTYRDDMIRTASENPLRHVGFLVDYYGMPGYDKVAYGVTCTSDVTVDALRLGCPWLNRWLSEIESLIVD